MPREVTIIAPSLVRSGSNFETPVDLTGTVGSEFHAGVFLLSVIAVTGTLPTLDVFVQIGLPDESFADFISFGPMSGVGKRVAVASFPTGSLEIIPVDAILAATTVLGYPLGPVYRVKWAIAGTASPSFTFSVTAHLYGSHLPPGA